VYSQNIDGLFYASSISPGRIVSVHGSLGKCSCEFCGEEGDIESFAQEVRNNIKDIYGVDNEAPQSSSHVLCASCGKPGMKPSTVLYGRSLPTKFFQAQEEDFSSGLVFVDSGSCESTADKGDERL